MNREVFPPPGFADRTSAEIWLEECGYHDCWTCGRWFDALPLVDFGDGTEARHCEECEAKRQNAGEIAEQRSIETFYGSSGPVTLDEQRTLRDRDL